MLDRLDGLVLTGGADVDPERYGEAPAERTSAPRVLRDEWETALARAALDRDLPLLADLPRAAGASTSRSAGRCTSTCPT